MPATTTAKDPVRREALQLLLKGTLNEYIALLINKAARPKAAGNVVSH